MAGPLGILAPLTGILQLFSPHLRPHPTSIKHLSVICSHQSLTVKGLTKWDLIASQEHLYTGAFHFKDKLLRVKESNSGPKVSKWGSDSLPCKCPSACYAGRPPVCCGLQSLALCSEESVWTWLKFSQPMRRRKLSGQTMDSFHGCLLNSWYLPGLSLGFEDISRNKNKAPSLMECSFWNRENNNK